MKWIRTPDSHFGDLRDWPYAPHYVDYQGMRHHYVDEGSAGSKVAMLIHGEPTWSYLFRQIIPGLRDAGYRCIIPDHMGFGRSDKPASDDWYVIARHYEALRELITTLDLRDITLFVHDWGGPIGLKQVVDMPDRFSRVVIFNTWLHRSDYEYAPKIHWWREAASDPKQLGGNMPTGDIVAKFLCRPGHNLAHVKKGFDAPFTDSASKAGARRFPYLLPFAEPELGQAAAQAETFIKLQKLNLPFHFMWGDADELLSVSSGQAWCQTLKNSTFDIISGAGHFVPEEAGAEIVPILLNHIRSSGA